MQHLAAKLPLGEPAGDEKRLLKGEFGQWRRIPLARLVAELKPRLCHGFKP